MTTVGVEIFMWSIAHGLSVANLSTGEDTSKTRWRPDRILFHEASQRSAKGASAMGVATGDVLLQVFRGSQRALRVWMAVAKARLGARR